ncbi:MAG: 7-methylguanosine phosphate-specific 5'-nucleotidase [Paramarteilia canceri]
MTKTVWMSPNIEKNYFQDSTCFGVIINEMIMNDTLFATINNRRLYYDPMFSNSNLTKAEKAEILPQYWLELEDAISKSSFSNEQIPDLLKSTDEFRLKKSVLPAFKLIADNDGSNRNIVIFSAGLENIIRYELLQNNFNMEKISIISNEIDEKTRRFRADHKLITSVDKRVFDLSELILDDEVDLFISFGDSFSDSEMVTEDRIKHSQRIVKVGLINQKNLSDVESLRSTMEKFATAFDVLIINDEEFDDVLYLLRLILDKN